MSRRWQKTFAADQAEIAAAADWIDDIAAAEKLPAPIVYAMRLCLEELLSNTIRHGGASQAEVEVSLAGDALRMVIEDNGKPFDVAAAPARHVDKPLDQLVPGGLGIGLVKNFASSVTYARVAGRNRVTLEFTR